MSANFLVPNLITGAGSFDHWALAPNIFFHMFELFMVNLFDVVGLDFDLVQGWRAGNKIVLEFHF